MDSILVSGSFDNLRSQHVRFLQEAAHLGKVHILLWSDEAVKLMDGHAPKFPQAERRYLLEAIRYVHQVTLVEQRMEPHSIPVEWIHHPATWIVPDNEDHELKRNFCKANGIIYQVISQERLASFPSPAPVTQVPSSGRKKVVVTGCFDWLHSGHIRFFEEVSQLGDLHVIVGHDENVRLLKGAGHPLFGQDERCYMVQSIRYVTSAMISSGSGWMDAEPEIARIRPDIYAVNQDGDQPEKRAFCASHGLEYVVLQRLPKEGLPRRESTKLRGF